MDGLPEVHAIAFVEGETTMVKLPKSEFDSMTDHLLAYHSMKVSRNPVLQDWVCKLTLMQQSVLITACRGPDGLRKDHISKVLCRWLRRCFLISAFDKRVIEDAYEPGGGSFTGPCNFPEDNPSINLALDEYLRHVDETPHHFHLHLMHAAEILGYKHPDLGIRAWWNLAYVKIVSDAHLMIESEELMDRRLGDNRDNWLAAEEVTAK